MKRIITILLIISSGPSISQNISNLYEKVKRSVVIIKSERIDFSTRSGFNTLTHIDGYGSGFVVSELGEIVTAAHVVKTSESITVTFLDGEEIPAEIVYIQPFTDLALIKLCYSKSTPLSVTKLADSDSVAVGDKIFIIGSPLGLSHSLSVGYVSAKHIKIDDEDNIHLELIQTDALINEGSSGAPVFNKKGAVIGVASFIMGKNNGFRGLSFASASNMIVELIENKDVPWMGMEVIKVNHILANVLNIPEPGGLLVKFVAKNSIGDKMGIIGGSYSVIIDGIELRGGGDIVLEIQNLPIKNDIDIERAWKEIKNLRPGNTISLKILRRGKVLNLKHRINED